MTECGALRQASACWWSGSGARAWRRRSCARRAARASPSPTAAPAERAGRGAGGAAGGRRRRSWAATREAIFTGADLIVLSPGVPEIPRAAWPRARPACAVTGEMELASRFVDGDAGRRSPAPTASRRRPPCAARSWPRPARPTFVGGNLGEPLAEAVGTPRGRRRRRLRRRGVELPARDRRDVSPARGGAAEHHRRSPRSLRRHRRLRRRQGAHLPRAAAPATSRWSTPTIRWSMRVSRGDRRAPAGLLDGAARAGGEGGWVDGRVAACCGCPAASEERYPAQLPALIGRHNQANALAALLAGRLAGATPAEARRGAARLPRAAAPHGAGRRGERRRLLRRFQGDQRRRGRRRAGRFSAAGGADRRRPRQGRRLRAAGGGAGRGRARRGADRRGGRSHRGGARRVAQRCRSMRAASMEEAVGDGGARWRARATPWCCRRPAPASTCSATTRTAPTCSARPCARRSRAGRRHERRRRGSDARSAPARRQRSSTVADDAAQAARRRRALDRWRRGAARRRAS